MPRATTIKLSKDTVKLLHNLKIHPRQPYDEVISDILKGHGTSKINPIPRISGIVTTIKISKTHVSKLNKLKIHPMQPYEEVVIALIHEYKEKK